MHLHSSTSTNNMLVYSADLKKSLYAIFSQFGKILDVVAMKTYRLRGQAWVVFADIKSAADALRCMQGFPFFDKPMVSAAPLCCYFVGARCLALFRITLAQRHARLCVCRLQRIAYAKEESDVVAKAKGQYVAKDKEERKKRNKEARGGQLSPAPHA